MIHWLYDRDGDGPLAGGPSVSTLPRFRRQIRGVNMLKIQRFDRSEQPKRPPEPVLARAVLIAGGAFAVSITTILGVAGRWRLSDLTIFGALGVLCVIATLTAFLVLILMSRE
ncbi:hypothetical protein [Paractinoplanes lichenicola]|uniref:Uncharacterized protein n=1 Tax=Paractinoplanes lichenicola TaxID=2802976 RepID=A0ABS1VNP6_9ACTN|nr:hypothetical protein [Actinoplanes lichenicola]MBL7256357.1 hypothetical protein [Actinoplanes lichenicola]